MKKDIFSIPNILSFVRILLIPIFVWLYLTAGTSGEYYLAAAVVVASGITDFLDGQIARRVRQISRSSCRQADAGNAVSLHSDKLSADVDTACYMAFKGRLYGDYGTCAFKDKADKARRRTLVRQGLHGYYLYCSAGFTVLPRSIPGGFACIIHTHSYLYRCNASFRYSLFGSTYKDVASQ